MYAFRRAAPVAELALPAPGPQGDTEQSPWGNAAAQGPSGPAHGPSALDLAAANAPESDDTSWAADAETDAATAGLAVAARVLQLGRAAGAAPPPWGDAVDQLTAAIAAADLDAFRAAVAGFDPALDLVSPEWVMHTWGPLVGSRTDEIALVGADGRLVDAQDPAAQLAALGAAGSRLASIASQVDPVFTGLDLGSKLALLVAGQAEFAGTSSLAGFATALNAAIKLHQADERGGKGATLISAMELGILVTGVGELCLDLTVQLAKQEGPEIAEQVASAIAPLQKAGGAFFGSMFGFLSLVGSLIQVGDARTPDERRDAWVGLAGSALECGSVLARLAGGALVAGVLSSAAISLSISWFVFKAAILEMGRTRYAVCAGLVVADLEQVHGSALKLFAETDEVATARAMADFESDPDRAEALRTHADFQVGVLGSLAVEVNRGLLGHRSSAQLVSRFRADLNEVTALSNQGAPIEQLVAAVTRFAESLNAAMADPGPIVEEIIGYDAQSEPTTESTT